MRVSFARNAYIGALHATYLSDRYPRCEICGLMYDKVMSCYICFQTLCMPVISTDILFTLQNTDYFIYTSVTSASFISISFKIFVFIFDCSK